MFLARIMWIDNIYCFIDVLLDLFSVYIGLSKIQQFPEKLIQPVMPF
jgi:hypothetical protein